MYEDEDNDGKFPDESPVETSDAALGSPCRDAAVADCPRTRGPFDQFRRAAAELSAFLEADAPGGGHDPALLREEHAQRFVADQRHRERHGLPSRASAGQTASRPRSPSPPAGATFNYLRAIAYRAMETGAADAIGLDRAFITALPPGGTEPSGPAAPSATRPPGRWPTRATCAAWRKTTTRTTAGCGTSGRPSSSPAAGAARSSSCAWTASAATTGCRCSGTTRPRSATSTRPSGSPSTSTPARRAAGQDAGPLRGPPRATADRGGTSGDGPVPDARPQPAEETGRSPTASSATSSRHGSTAWTSGGWSRTRPGTRWPPTCCAPGPRLAHIRQFLGHVSDRMAEHYIKVAHSDLEDVLQRGLGRRPRLAPTRASCCPAA